MMLFLFYKLFIPLFLLVSCSAYPDLEEVLGNNQKVSISESDPGFRAELRAGSMPHQYSVYLEWNLNTKGALSLYRYEGAGAEAEFLGTYSANQVLTDQNLKEQTHYTYELRGVGEISRFVDLRTGRDLWVKEHMKLPQDYRSYNRLFIEKDGSLVTQGRSLEWTLDYLQAEKGARLVSFDGDDVNLDISKEALSSGQIRLNVAYAQGALIFDWRGQTGAEGKKGNDNLQRGARGSKGTPGKVISGECRFIGGALECEPNTCKNGSRGSQGGVGPQGHAGTKGGQGGALENVYVRIKNSAPDFFMHVQTQGGTPGMGGQGGLGGLGGEGGPGGDGRGCASGAQGPDGPRGLEGPRGPQGESGSHNADVCVLIGEEMLRGPCNLLR